MRAHVLTFFTGMVVTLSFTSVAQSGPPMTGSSHSSGDSHWFGTLNPKQWSWPTMPSMPWAEEPARIQKKQKSFVANMNNSAKSGWAKTKHALDPTKLFESDPKRPKKSSAKQSEGFFGGLFKPEEKPREIRTVNDFLSQPQPK